MSGKTFRTLCQLCHNNCGVIVEQKADGKITVKGDPDHSINRGYCCPKVLANVEIQRSPDRLKSPLLKTPTGFKRISWDEALTIAADKLGEIRNRYGPLSLVRCSGAPVSYQARDGFLEFMGAYGSPNLTSIANICMAPRMMAFKSVTGAIRAEPDYDNTRLVLFWGSNPVGIERYASYAAYNGMKKILPRLKERNVKTICIDPYQSETAKQTDEWVRIKPGGDNALGLAMIHVIIKEKLYDRDFVASYTSGFEELQNHVLAFDPQWAEQPTGLTASTIENLARTYASSGPAAVYEGNGLDMYTTGVDAVRTIAILIGLTGNMDVPGGNVFMPFPHPPALPTRPAPMTERIGYDRFPAPIHAPFPVIKEALLNQENGRPRAMIVHHGNPVLIQANAARIRQAFEKLDFLMVCDIFPTATTELADLEERICSTHSGSITSVQAVYVPADDMSDPAVNAILSHLDTTVILSRSQAAKGIYPAVDPLHSTSKMMDRHTLGDQHYAIAEGVREAMARYAELEDIITMLGVEELSGHDRLLVMRARKLQRYLTQPFWVTAAYTGMEGRSVALGDTLDDCEAFLRGDFDAVPEDQCYFRGSMKESPP